MRFKILLRGGVVAVAITTLHKGGAIGVYCNTVIVSVQYVPVATLNIFFLATVNFFTRSYQQNHQQCWHLQEITTFTCGTWHPPHPVLVGMIAYNL